MTYRPRPSRESLVLAAVDLALSEEVEGLPVHDRPGVLELLLGALGVPEDGILVAAHTPGLGDGRYSRQSIAAELVEVGLILDEADVMGVDGPLVRAELREEATVAQREAHLEYLGRAFRELVEAAVESLPPSTVRRP